MSRNEYSLLVIKACCFFCLTKLNNKNFAVIKKKTVIDLVGEMSELKLKLGIKMTQSIAPTHNFPPYVIETVQLMIMIILG